MGTKLVDVYCDCNNLMYAWDGPYEVAIKLFYEMVGWGKDVFVGAALIVMYPKCGCDGNAREVFDEVGDRETVMWNSMFAAYSQNGQFDDTLSLYREMAVTGVRPRWLRW